LSLSDKGHRKREKIYEAVNKQIATEWQAPILYKYEKNNQQLSGFAKQMPNEEAKNTQETWRHIKSSR
jgi:putative ABC transport system permease protein